ncbi:MAG TPA: uridine kinase [Bacteroidetes bacterium]|nr:uridine kinase [Bacteroidota bacterium]
MLEDILLIEEKHRRVGAGIVKEILKNKKDKFIVAISGESGSGKSELTHVVAKEMRKYGVFAKPVHLDNFFKTLPLERRAWREKHGIANVVGINEIDWEAVQKTVDDFKNGRTSSMPCVDLVTEQVDTLTTDFKTIDMMVLDGLYAINTEDVDLHVFIELTYHETKKAQASRGKEKTDEQRMQTLEAEHKAVKSLRPKADLLINMNYELEKA